MYRQVMFGCVALSVALLLIGCSSANELKYGKLYAMQQVLFDADGDCGNREARVRAINWAMHGLQDLRASRQHMNPRSSDYQENRRLTTTLMQMTSGNNKSVDQLCLHIKQASQATDDFLLSTKETRYAAIETE